MNTRQQAVLDGLRSGFTAAVAVKLTPAEIRFILLQRQSDSLTISGVDPEFELAFGESMQELQRALLGKPQPHLQPAAVEAVAKTGKRDKKRAAVAAK